MREAVEKHSARIEQRVMEAIDKMDDYRLAELMRDALVMRLGGEGK